MDEFSEKFQKGGGSFSIQKFILQIFAIIDDTLVMNFRKNLQYDFPKNEGGGQRPFGTFLKINPFRRCYPSLIQQYNETPWRRFFLEKMILSVLNTRFFRIRFLSPDFQRRCFDISADIKRY